LILRILFFTETVFPKEGGITFFSLLVDLNIRYWEPQKLEEFYKKPKKKSKGKKEKQEKLYNFLISINMSDKFVICVAIILSCENKKLILNILANKCLVQQFYNIVYKYNMD
jgi:hypothetical protein